MFDFITKVLIAVSLLSIPLRITAQDAPEKWTPKLMAEFKRIGETAISHDGSLIAYTVSTPLMEEEKSEYLTHIWVVSADGKMNRQFTHGTKSCTNPSFSPDAKYLAFTSKQGDDDEENQVWLLSVAGGEAEKLTSTENDVIFYAWSPDGQRVAFTMADPETEDEKTRKKEKRDMRVLDTNFKFVHLYTISIDERKTQRLTSGDFHLSTLFGNATPFDWSPDGKTIAFQHRKTPRINDWPTTDISKVASDSGAVTPLVSWDGFDGSPRYSPDGKWLTFISDGGDPKWAFANDLYIIPIAGGEPQKLAETADRQPNVLAWSADSRNIFYSETDRTSRRLFTLPTNGKSARVVTTGTGNFTDISISRNGKSVAFVHETTATAPNVHIGSTKKLAPKKLTDVNSDFPLLPMGKTEVISWKSKDGRKIEGLLTYPIDYQLDKPSPLILMIHGGPTGVYTQSFTARSSVYPIQAFSQDGYAVLRINPRGSSGYGKEFRFANYNDWGFGDYDDLMSGVNKAVQMGVAHPDSLCVMGWSYGGFMTSFIVTKTKRFKAASVGAGVTNLMSFTGTADIPSFIPDYFGSEPWDDLEPYKKHSAMFQVKGVTTPTQVIHGEKDIRVPLSQGLEFYNALKRQKCPTEMIVYPRTPHGVREPKFMIDVGERIIAWFDKNLGRVRKPKVMVTK